MHPAKLPLQRLALVLLCLCLGLSHHVRAHPISMSAAAVNVKTDQILVNLKIMLEDLVMYHNLQTGPDERFSHADLVQAAEQHRTFILNYFSIRDAQGELLSGEIRRLDLSHIPPEGAPQAALMTYNVFYHMVFPLSQPQTFITLTQIFGGTDAVLPAVMDLIVFQNQVLLQQSVPLQQNRPHTVRFDWDHPPTASAQRGRPDVLQKREEVQEQLGITSYSGWYSFLYIDDHEVRHEILIPLVTLEQWLPLERAQPDFIDVPEQDAARDKIAAFFRRRAVLSIDGTAIEPVVQRLQFFGLDINDFARNAEPRRVSVYQARLGIILSYPAKGAPHRVDMTWELFHPYAPFLRSVVYAYDQDPQIHDFKPNQPGLSWIRQGDAPPPVLLTLPEPKPLPRWPLPLLSLVAFGGAVLWLPISGWQRHGSLARRLAGALVLLIIGGLCWPFARISVPSPFVPVPQLSDAEANALASALLRNIYRAFDYRTESDIYDALAQSVDGQLLETLYLQIQQGLHMQEQGGAVARVQDVRLIDNQVVDAGINANGMPRFDIKSRWRVTGTVEHWGHIHTRENQYEAILAVSAQPGYWKMTAYTLLDEQRVRFQTGLRRAQPAS